MSSHANSWFHVVAAELDKDILCRLVKAYSPLIEAISKQQDKKPSKHTEDLASLDEFRYKELPSLLEARGGFGNNKKDNRNYLELDELKRLLEWKMSRGVFRPSLRGLIASNSSDIVKSVTSEAFTEFASSSSGDLNQSIQRSTKMLCKLRGVGPATASLILSVAYPNEVAFFADELFAWISLQDKQSLDTFLQQRYPQGIGEGVEGKRVDKIAGIKYSDAEYKSLCTTILQLRKQLQSSDEVLSATDIEKAAYVVLQGLEVSWDSPELLKDDQKDVLEMTDPASNTKQNTKATKLHRVTQQSSSPSEDTQEPNDKVANHRTVSTRQSKRLQTQDKDSISKRRKTSSS